MTEAQKNLLFQLLAQHCIEFHHGDCIGADAEAQQMAKALNAKTVCHPPNNLTKRAFTKNDDTYREAPYLERNKRIVTVTEQLIACPKETTEQLRSGTWSTIRFARKMKRPITIICPDGTVILENNL